MVIFVYSPQLYNYWLIWLVISDTIPPAVNFEIEHHPTSSAASLPQLWLGSPASGFKRLASKQAVGQDHQAALWLLLLWRWWLLRWFLHFPGWYSQCLVAGWHLVIYSLASPHANLPWQEHHSFSEPCSAPSTCCQCHPCQPGTKHQCHSWRKYRHTDGSPLRKHLAVLLKDVAGLDVLALKPDQRRVKFKPAELARPASQHAKISGFQDLPSCYSCSGVRFERLFEDPLTGTM